MGERWENGRRLSDDDEEMMFSGVESLRVRSENE